MTALHILYSTRTYLSLTHNICMYTSLNKEEEEGGGIKIVMDGLMVLKLQGWIQDGFLLLFWGRRFQFTLLAKNSMYIGSWS